MNLSDVMEEIRDRLDTITGLRCYGYPPDNVAVPSAIVTYPEEYPFDSTYGRGMDQVTLPVVVMVGRASDRAARELIGPYCDGAGASSVKAVLEGAASPGWLDLPGGAGNYAQTPHRPALSIPGAMWMAVDAALDDWTPAAISTLLSKWLTTFNLRAYSLDVLTTGQPRAVISSTGANELSATGDALGFSDGTRHAIGVEIVPNDGAGNRTVQFYTAPTLAGPWTPHGALITQAGAVSIFATSQILVVGALNSGAAQVSAGLFYGAEVRSGGRTGTLVANPDFTAQAAGTHAFLDSLENPWIMEGTAQIVAGSPAPYTAFDSLRVQGAVFDVVQMAGVEYLAATFNLDIAGQGA